MPSAQGRSFWEALTQGSDLVTEVPPDRWAQEAFYHPSRNHLGAAYTKRAGSIGDVGGFDPAFFGISPREAEQMDPQQRLLLEMAWEAFESGGLKPSAVKGQKGGVFIGFSGSDWSYRASDDLAAMDAGTMTGQTGSIAANRLSYFFDLRGPSFAVDTACSSSLVAFHQACRSLQSGESEMALAGGISLHMTPNAFVGFSRASMLSPRGVCNVFDEAGDGYVRSEGGGIFILKPLDRAVEDGDRIFAVVAGSGVNCDGRTNGITVPGSETQAELLQEVYQEAGIDPSDVDYLEAHGTGTAVGDPIECHSLGEVLGRHRPKDRPLLIGSVKSNVGHLETASGVAGLVKALLCLENRSVPPTIHLKNPNPYIKFDEWNLKVVTSNTPLDLDKQLTIGVNSFGFGGANAHVVLQSPSAGDTSSRDGRGETPADAAPLIVTARGDGAMRAAAVRLADFGREHPELTHYDIAYSSARHRDWHPNRAVAFAGEPEQQLEDLRAFADGSAPETVVSGVALEDASAPVFVFSGNGSQWAGMGRELLTQSAIFAEAVRSVDALFVRYADFSILDELTGEDIEQRLALTEVAQPLLFAVQVGVTRMLRDMGVTPGAVVGHSVGEVAAAWASGALTLEQAVQVIHERSLQQGTTKGAGGMTAVGLSAEQSGQLLKESGLDDALAIAGINSPRGVTVAGPTGNLDILEAALAEQEVFHRRLGLDYAFHSPAMDVIRAPLERDLAGLKPGKGNLPFYSTVTGARLAGSKLDAGYWWLNIREPVQFQQAVDALIGDGYNIFVEIGPHAVLRTYVNDCLRAAGREGRVIPTLKRDDDSERRVQAAFYQLLVDGAALDLDRVFPRKGQFVPIPTYPWQKERYWHPVSSEGYNLINRYKEHPLLGYRLRENDTQWENQLDTVLYPQLADHAVGEAVVFPAAGFVEMALAAAQLWKTAAARKVSYGGDEVQDFIPQEVEELEILAPLLLDDENAKMVRLAIDPADGRFTIKSRQRLSDDAWQLHVVGRLPGRPLGGVLPERLALPAGEPQLAAVDHYALTGRVGLNYGPAYQAVEAVWTEADAVTAKLQVPLSVEEELPASHLHPSLLDGCFQLLVDILREEVGSHGGVAFVPVKVGRLRLYGRGTDISHARAEMLRRNPRSLVARFRLYDGRGEIIAELDEVRFRGVMLQRSLVERVGHLRFEAVARPLDDARPAVLPATGELLGIARKVLHAPERLAERGQYYAEVEPLLDVLCTAFAEQALRQLTQGSAGVDIEQMIGSGVVRREYHAYLRHLAALLQEDGLLEPSGNGLVWSDGAEIPPADAIWTSLLGDYPDYAAEILLLGRIGSHLADVLRGDLELAALLPADAAHPMLAHYQASPSLSGAARAVTAMLVTAQQALPDGGRLRILELTLGRSPLAGRVLPALDPDRCDYTIASTLEEALEGVALVREAFPSVQTRLLALDDHAAQGRYDMVLISQELAMAAEPERLLGMLSSHLAPGGALLLAEQPASRWADTVFGLRPDWWRAGDGQVLSSQRSAKAWGMQLARYGLPDASVVHDLPDSPEGPYLLVARASQTVEAVEQSSTDSQGCWLILQDAAGEGAVLAGLVAARLYEEGQLPSFLAQAGDEFVLDEEGDCVVRPTEAEDLQQLLGMIDERKGGLAGVMLLHGMPYGPAQQDAALDRCVVAAELAKDCAASGLTPQLLLVTAGATADLVPGQPAAPIDDAALWGFGRTLMNEYPDMRIRLLELADPFDPEASAGEISSEILTPDAEDEVIYSRSGRYAPRLRAVSLAGLLPRQETPEDGRSVRLDFSAPGPLKNLTWRQACLPPLGAGDVEISVRAAGLNFRDIMYAMGLLSDEALEAGFAGPTLGMELSGVITAVGGEVADLAVGDEVIAFAPASFADRTVTPASAVARKPAAWSFNAAATVPTTFFTAYYALHHLAQLQEGERLLVHGAAGGVGLAAIQLGKAMGAEIFATAGSDAKRDVVRLLGADHILDSRSLAFADDVLALTDGEGVDVVLNSLAGEAINRNLRILRPFGRFMELGKRDFYENTRIGLRPFRNNISYFGIDADQLMSERPALTRRLFNELMGLFEEGELRPLPYRAFAATEAVEAFRYMQQSRQIGKVVLDLSEGVGELQPEPPAPGALALAPEATYLVTGGMRGFGLATARWLADKGARHLVLLSRRGAADEEGAEVIETMQAEGVRVQAVACDVTDRDSLATVFDNIAETMPPLRGIVHAAMVIDDGLVRSLDAERIAKVFAPKVQGARHLDALSRDLELDFFVLYSSATTLFGNPGQSSYVAANRYLEALAHARREAGLPALCVSWGAIDDVGYLARNTEIKEQLQSRMGGAALRSSEALSALEQMLLNQLSGLGVMELEWGALRRFLPTALSPKFEDLAHQAEEAGADAEGLEQLQQWLEEMDDEELAHVLAEVMKKEVGEILHVSPERIEDDRSLYDLGMDSLMGMELVAAVEARLGVSLPVMALSEGPTISRLVDRVIRQLRSPHDEDEHAGARDVSRLAARHDKEVDEEIAADVARSVEQQSSTQRSLMDDK